MDFDADDHFFFSFFLFFFFFFTAVQIYEACLFFGSRQVRRHWGINNSYIPLCAHARHQSCVFVCAVITPAGPKRLFLFSFFFLHIPTSVYFWNQKQKRDQGSIPLNLNTKIRGLIIEINIWIHFFSSHIHPVLWSRMTALWKNDNTLCYGKKGELVQAKNALFRQLRSHQGPSMD